jgi:hypothetical protein
MIMVLKTMECLKVLINCLYDWSQFTGEDAKWFNECRQSSKEDITMYEFTREETISYLRGNKDTVTVYGTDCSPKTGFWPIFGPETAGTLDRQLFMNLISWMARNNNSAAIKM